MSDDYFTQRKAEVDAENERRKQAEASAREARAQANKAAADHFVRVVIPFFENKAIAVREAGAFLELQRSGSSTNQPPTRLDLQLKASNLPKAQAGRMISISIVPSLQVVRQPPLTNLPTKLNAEYVELGTNMADELNEGRLENLHRMMVDEFFVR